MDMNTVENQTVKVSSVLSVLSLIGLGIVSWYAAAVESALAGRELDIAVELQSLQHGPIRRQPFDR